MPTSKSVSIAACAVFFSLAVPASLLAQGDQRQRGERPDMFAMADLDKSGGVTLEELRESRAQMMERRGEGGPGGGARREGGAGGGQGGANREEMMERMKQRMEEGFKKADADNNGELSREEFAAMDMGGRGQGRGQGGPGGEGRPRGPRPE